LLLVDDRIGSKDLLRPFQLAGVNAELAHLEFGDFSFVGNGIGGTNVYIGIELKETRDLISSMHSGRFAGHQLPGLVETYDRVWLITEGIWRTGAEGVLEVLQGGWRPVSVGKHRVMSSDMDAWILTQVIRGGINHAHCSTRTDTVRFVASLFRWWTSKDLEQHRAHQTIYLPPPDRASFVEPTTERKMLSCIPKVGWDKSASVLQHFNGSLRSALAASTEELLLIDGVGPIIASNIAAIK
jgi:ERCC4-type nuclease